MNVLVLGGGFMAKTMQSVLSELGHNVNLTGGKNMVDLRDKRLTKSVVAAMRPDAVVNAAAHVGSLNYVTDRAAEVCSDNASILCSVFDAVRLCSPSAVVINPIANCAYPGDAAVQSEQDWLRGDMHPSVAAYGATRRLGWHLSVANAAAGVRTVNFIVPNAYGPMDSLDPNRTHALNGLVIRAIAARRAGEEELSVWGTGRPVREWVYMPDFARLTGAVLARPELWGEMLHPVNVAQRDGKSIAESAREVAHAVRYTGRLSFDASKQDGAPSKVMDDRRFRSLFPDFVFTGHADGIKRTVAYYESET